RFWRGLTGHMMIVLIRSPLILNDTSDPFANDFGNRIPPPAASSTFLMKALLALPLRHTGVTYPNFLAHRHLQRRREEKPGPGHFRRSHGHPRRRRLRLDHRPQYVSAEEDRRAEVPRPGAVDLCKGLSRRGIRPFAH